MTKTSGSYPSHTKVDTERLPSRPGPQLATDLDLPSPSQLIMLSKWTYLSNLTKTDFLLMLKYKHFNMLT